MMHLALLEPKLHTIISQSIPLSPKKKEGCVDCTPFSWTNTSRYCNGKFFQEPLVMGTGSRNGTVCLIWWSCGLTVSLHETLFVGSALATIFSGSAGVIWVSSWILTIPPSVWVLEGEIQWHIIIILIPILWVSFDQYIAPLNALLCRWLGFLDSGILSLIGSGRWVSLWRSWWFQFDGCLGLWWSLVLWTWGLSQPGRVCGCGWWWGPGPTCWQDRWCSRWDGWLSSHKMWRNMLQHHHLLRHTEFQPLKSHKKIPRKVLLFLSL